MLQTNHKHFVFIHILLLVSMKHEFHTVLFNNRYVVGYHTNLTSGAKILVTQHYTYTNDQIKELLWASDQLLAHAHHISSDQPLCL